MDETQINDALDAERPEPGTTEDSGTKNATETTETSRAADVTGEKEPGPVPYARFKEKNDLANRYSKLGKPEELEARLTKAADYERRQQEAVEADRQRQEQERRQTNPKLADAEDLVEDIIERKYPGIRQHQQQQEQDRQLAIARHVQHGMEQIPALLKEHGIPVTKDSIESYETLVESQIIKDPELKQGFWRPAEQADVMKEAFTRAKTRVLNPAMQAAGAKTLDDARERASRVLSRGQQTGTAKVAPKAFASTHKPGTAQHDADRDRYRRQLIHDHLAQQDAEEAQAI